MSARFLRLAQTALPLRALGLTAGLVLSACGTVDGMSQRIAGSVAPYKVAVVQGNFVSKEQVDALKPGMSRQQVKEVLGTPLVASVFHADRWDYVFTLVRQDVEPQRRVLALFFKGDALERFEGDTMPTEAEFVATLDAKYKNRKAPPLEASEESLKQYPPRADAPAEPQQAAPAPLPASYPPLEAPSR